MPCTWTTLFLLNKKNTFRLPVFTVRARLVDFSVAFTLFLATHIAATFSSRSLSARGVARSSASSRWTWRRRKNLDWRSIESLIRVHGQWWMMLVWASCPSVENPAEQPYGFTVTKSGYLPFLSFAAAPCWVKHSQSQARSIPSNSWISKIKIERIYLQLKHEKAMNKWNIFSSNQF